MSDVVILRACTKEAYIESYTDGTKEDKEAYAAGSYKRERENTDALTNCQMRVVSINQIPK